MKDFRSQALVHNEAPHYCGDQAPTKPPPKGAPDHRILNLERSYWQCFDRYTSLKVILANHPRDDAEAVWELEERERQAGRELDAFAAKLYSTPAETLVGIAAKFRVTFQTRNLDHARRFLSADLLDIAGLIAVLEDVRRLQVPS